MKPFDLKAAQAGEPIVRYYSSDGSSRPVNFIGVSSRGGIVCENVKDPTAIFCHEPEELRMAPRKLKMNIELTFRNGVIHSSWVTQKDLPKQKDGPEWAYRYTTIEVDAP